MATQTFCLSIKLNIELCHLLQPSYLLYIDFLSITGSFPYRENIFPLRLNLILVSDTQEGPKLMHPSVATSCNKKRKIDSQEDIQELVEEFQQKNLYESIIESHNRARFARDRQT